MLRAEKKIRHWAEIFPNSYLIGIYACCRQLYSPNLSTGIFSEEQKDEYLNDIGAKKKEYDNRIKELEAELEKLEEQKKRIIEGNENEKQESSEEEKEFNDGCIFEKPEVLTRGHQVHVGRISKLEERAKFTDYLVMPTKFSFPVVVRIQSLVIKFVTKFSRIEQKESQ